MPEIEGTFVELAKKFLDNNQIDHIYSINEPKYIRIKRGNQKITIDEVGCVTGVSIDTQNGISGFSKISKVVRELPSNHEMIEFRKYRGSKDIDIITDLPFEKGKLSGTHSAFSIPKALKNDALTGSKHLTESFIISNCNCNSNNKLKCKVTKQYGRI